MFKEPPWSTVSSTAAFWESVASGIAGLILTDSKIQKKQIRIKWSYSAMKEYSPPPDFFFILHIFTIKEFR